MWILAGQASCSIASCAPGGGDALPEPETQCSEGVPPANGDEIAIIGKSSENLEFVPLVPNEHLEIHHGPQGGQHVFVSIRFFAKTEGVWSHYLEFIDAEDGMIAGSGSAIVAACASGWTVLHN